jgi:hypothetical protein
MDARQEAAFNELLINPELSKSLLASIYEITEEEAQDVIDFYHAWRED